MLDEPVGYHVDSRGLIEFEGGVETANYWLFSSDNFHFC